MFVAVFGHVHICYIRHVVFHERRKSRWSGPRLQLPYVRTINDTSFYGKLLTSCSVVIVLGDNDILVFSIEF